MSDNSSDDLAIRLEQLHIQHNNELVALHARHHSERAALLASVPSSAPPVAAVTVSPPVAVPVSTINTELPSWDLIGEPLSVGDTVCVLNRGHTNKKGEIANIVSLSKRKRNWVQLQFVASRLITWCAGFNLERL